MREMLLLKCGELVLKGLNRGKFEQRLLDNLKWRLRPCGGCSIYDMQSTIYVEPASADFDMDRAYTLCRRVFGIVTLCRAAVCEKDMAAILETAPAYLEAELAGAKTFRVQARRSDKKFPLNSMEIMREAGGALLSRYPHLRVDLENPDVTVYIEVRDKKAFVHGSPVEGAGGLPAGINGRSTLLISGGIDSPVAAYMIARRGVSLHAVHFFSHPYTSERAKEKVVELLRLVSQYAGHIALDVVPFTELQEAIRDFCPTPLFTVVMRRYMMRIAELLAVQNGGSALITGENLGQVASQTLEALVVTDAIVGMPVFRPLIGMDKKDIVDIARRIGTFETSILPYEDCCTVFTPKHPETKPRLDHVERAEAALSEALTAKTGEGADALAARLASQAERIEIG